MLGGFSSIMASKGIAYQRSVLSANEQNDKTIENTWLTFDQHLDYRFAFHSEIYQSLILLNDIGAVFADALLSSTLLFDKASLSHKRARDVQNIIKEKVLKQVKAAAE